MTTTIAGLRRVFGNLVDDTGVEGSELALAPFNAEEAAEILDAAAEIRMPVRIVGGGTHSGFGYPVDAALAVTSRRMHRLVEWSPDDLTAVVQAGMTVAGLERQLAERGQTAVLPEVAGAATVGGVVAAGISGHRRLRYGPTRDRVLEAVLATGDGRVVRAGGRVVKNVTGYDLPRLATGSFGSLGMITQVALKLWPIGAATATVRVPDAAAALRSAFRPLAVLEVDGEGAVYLAGTPEEVDSQAGALGGTVDAGLDWPDPFDLPYEMALRVPPRHVSAAISRVPRGWRYRAAHGVGEVVIAGAGASAAVLEELRGWARELGGALVVARAPAEFAGSFDPWGPPPGSTELQRQVKLAFDPLRICNPGILPGRL